MILMYLCLSTYAMAQQKSWLVAVTNNATSLPVSGYPQLFYANLHPGIDAAFNKQINKSEKNRLIWRAQSSLYYHRFVQMLITASPMIMYERNLGNANYLNVALGSGVGLSFEHEGTFKLNSEGMYEQRSKLLPRGQYIFNFQIGYSHALQKNKPYSKRVTLGLRSTLQGTFVKSYVPLLPVNAVFVGIQFPLTPKDNKN
jgi:hypothetical protein